MTKYLVLFFYLSATITFAQQKKLTMQEAVLGLRTTLAPENLKQLAWIPGQNAYTSVAANKSGEVLMSTIVPSLKTDTLLTLAGLNQQIKDTLKSFPALTWLNDQTLYFKSGSNLYLLSIKDADDKTTQSHHLSSTAYPIPDKAANINIEKTTGRIAYTLDNNLYLLQPGGASNAVTRDTDGSIVNGQAVHRNEFGIDKGIFFSHKGNFLAFYRMDESKVADYPIVDWSVTPAKNTLIKYPMAGQVSHEVTLGVYNIATQNTLFLPTGSPKDQYLTCVTWSPDEKHIYVALLNREQNHLKLNQYDARTGEFQKTLFEEADPKYVEPQNALYFLPGKDNEFVWWSQRDGFMHLYLYNTGGKLIRQITKGDWLVNEIRGHNAKEKELVITASKDSPLERHIYTVNWTTGKMNRVDDEPGIHNATVSSDGKYIIDHFQNAGTPRKINLLSADKKWKKNILSAANTLAAYNRPRVEGIQLQAEDGTPLYGKLIYPTDFDTTKKYPVIVYLYNGPHVQLITNGYPESGNLWYELLAQKGYIVFTMDGRGSSNRGLKFEQAPFRQLGTVEMADQLKGVAYLKSLPFVDKERMGVHGWSYGGFMTTSLMLHHPDVFKVGVAGGPVIDWSMYEVMYTERYMDSPQENPQGYAENNLLDKTRNLKGKLLVIHGAQDDVVVWQHSIKFVKSCVDNNIQLDYFVYPGHPHNVQGKDRVHLMEKITDYFDQYLKK